MPTMNAAVLDQYGPPENLHYRQIERPSIEANEMLVKVHASSINPVDCNVRRGDLKSFVRIKLPAILGIDCAGEVVGVGAAVKDFQVGDAVFSFNHLKSAGAYAEYAVVSPQWARPKPKNLSYLEAAVLPGAAQTALQGLRNQAKLKPGGLVLLIGASGGVGTCALQIAKAMGAKVTAVCSTSNVGLIRALGAERVIDYKQEEVLQDKGRYDVVFDCVGTHSFWEFRKLIAPHGTHVVVPGSPRHMLNSILAKLDFQHSSKWFFADPSASDLAWISELVEAGKLKAIVDKTFALTALPEAHRYSEAGHTVGKIGVTIA